MPARRRQRPTAIAIACALLVTASTLSNGRGGRVAHADARPAPVGLRVLAPRAAYGIYDSGGRCALLSGPGIGRPVPIASVFKLWVLDALAREVASGSLRWSDPITIRDRLRSDPSGEAFGLPAGRRVSVARLARLMISISDNTATDHLVDRLGRAAVAKVVRQLAPDGAARTLPLLTTAEMARLKFVRPELGRQYARLDPAGKEAFIRTLARRAPLPRSAAAMARLDLTTPRLVDEVEWFASGRDICRTLADLARLARLPGMAPVGDTLATEGALPPGQAAAWDTAWFKGGSEPGVVALAYRLALGARDRVVVIGLSDPRRPLVERPKGAALIAEILARARG